MTTKEITGYYGNQQTPATVYIYENRNGSYWYAVEGSINVNCTHSEIEEGENIEALPDFDTFTTITPINSINDLIEAVES